MFAKFKNFFRSEPYVRPTKDVGVIKLTVEFIDGTTDCVDVEGDYIECGSYMGDMGFDASYVADQYIKRAFKTGWFTADKTEAISPHQISKILIGERKQLIKESR